MRARLEAGLAIFLSEGKTITKAKSRKRQEKPSEPKIVEIEIEFLPVALRNKHFAE